MAEIRTCEMHTGGEPLRIVEAGYPEIPGATILQKRAHAARELDHLRRLIMLEPRGHAGMYGAIPVEPDHPKADLAVLFCHNEGYSTMCGHGVIALGRYAVDKGLVPAKEPETEVRIQCPCGLVPAKVEVRNGRPGRVRFLSVPAFGALLDKTVETRTWGPVGVDIGYGGAFYAIVPAATLGLDVTASEVRDIVDAGAAISEAVSEQIALSHPDDPALAFLYGTILTDAGTGRDTPSANVTIFAGRQIDRSPCGSGVTAQLAVAHRRKTVRLDDLRSFSGPTGSVFQAAVKEETRCGPYPAVRVEVAGSAHYTGEALFRAEMDDPLGGGFRLD